MRKEGKERRVEGGVEFDEEEREDKTEKGKVE